MNAHQDGHEGEALHDAFEALLIEANEPVFPSVTDAALTQGRRVRRRRMIATVAGAVVGVAVLSMATTMGASDPPPSDPADPPAPTSEIEPSPPPSTSLPSLFPTSSPSSHTAPSDSSPPVEHNPTGLPEWTSGSPEWPSGPTGFPSSS